MPLASLPVDHARFVRAGLLGGVATYRRYGEAMYAAMGHQGGSVAGYRAEVCRRGHARSGGNLYVSPRGLSQCRACKAITDTRARGKRVA